MKENRKLCIDYPKKWSWISFDYDKGHKDATEKYERLILHKDAEIKKLEDKLKLSDKI